MDGASSDHIPLDSDPPSLVDEGLRIARQYGLGAEFESELEDLKKATTAAAAAQETPTTIIDDETDDGSMALSSAAWNHGPGMSDADQENMMT